LGPSKTAWQAAWHAHIIPPAPTQTFDNREQMLCSRLLPYVAHALAAPENNEIRYSDNGFSGMIIMDAQGAILYHSQEAKSLLALAAQSDINCGCAH